MMTIEKLRDLHPNLVYKAYSVKKTEAGLVVVYSYTLEPDIELKSTFYFPRPQGVDITTIDRFLFQLGVVEAISYWKAACPKELFVEAGQLSSTSTRFFEDLFFHGLGEFYYINKIDFTVNDFFTIRSGGEGRKEPIAIDTKPTDLVLVGGGKDSSLLLSLLAKKSNRKIAPMVVNPSGAALDTIRALSLKDPIVVTRVLDPKLQELNKNGYLNGHTPFSALLSFIGSTVAALYGYENVIVANEQGANEGNVLYKGTEINHQYSKSLRYENLFRAHIENELTPSIAYFSAMRPFNDLQISKMFSQELQILPLFRSCNKARISNGWCGNCAKCAFTYLTLFPFVSYETMMKIFGEDYFLKATILTFLRELVGIDAVKPFECVGTRDEAKLALLFSLRLYKSIKRKIPEGLLLIKVEAGIKDQDVNELSTRAFNHIDGNHNVPDEHATLLLSAWEKSQKEP